MIKFMMGNNFEKDLINNVIELNKTHKKCQVIEMYGSVSTTFPRYTARPLYRLPNKTLEQFAEIKQIVEDNGITFNFTMNGPNIDKTKFDKDQFIEFLKIYNIKRITVSSTFMLEVLQNSDLDIDIELSTIYQIESIYKMSLLLQRYPKIKKVCMSLMKNRDMEFLKRFKAAFPNLELELMVNEFCLFHCPNRMMCYTNHQNVKTVEESKLFANYPMRDCIQARNTSFTEWLKTRFILPEWIHYYEDIGIDRFKITGRTADTKFITKVLEIYMDRVEGIEHDYSFGDLWFHLENIGNTKENKFTPDLLKKIKYEHLKVFEHALFTFNQVGPRRLTLIDCDNECGVECNICEWFADDIIKKVTNE